MTLGEKLKALREARGWTQRQLSEESGVRQATISDLESGKVQDTRGVTLRRLARALNVSMDYLGGMYNGAEDPNPSPVEEPSLVGAALPPVTIP